MEIQLSTHEAPHSGFEHWCQKFVLSCAWGPTNSQAVLFSQLVLLWKNPKSSKTQSNEKPSSSLREENSEFIMRGPRWALILAVGSVETFPL